MGAQNQQKINQTLNTDAQSVNVVNNFQGRSRNATYQQSRKGFARYSTVPQNYQYTTICTNCSQQLSRKHRQICSATGKNCHKYGITEHFAKKCRRPKKSQSQTPKPLKNVNQIDTNTNKSDDEESVNYITSYQQLSEQVYYSNYNSDSDDYVAAISSDSAIQLEPLIKKINLETSWQTR